ncbi:MAG: hypothetical protein L6244_04790 [Candidatus Methanoperedenaceae archaeon]|nr:hypothetical protein [Euryarchaeota archaeon]MCG2727945.1 hypothetical protein [Candidatus Methanoperedenaceae archaeon]
MARVKFDEKYISAELEKVGTVLTSPVTLYLLGGAAMIKYGLKAATKDIDVLLSTLKETEELIHALLKSGYQIIQTDRLGAEYQEMLATQILENADGFRWDIFHEYVCKKLKFSTGMIERSKVLFEPGLLTVRLISKEDIFIFKTVTERDDDDTDLLLLARSKVDWELVLKECMSQSREDLRCEVDLFDKLDELGTSYGLETPIYDRISQAARIGMEKWFEEQIIEELKMSPRTMEELLVRFKCGRETLLPSLFNLEKMGRIKKSL